MTIVLVTGANRGIGFAIVQAAACRIVDATFILGCRSLEAGHKAVENLRDLNIEAKFDVVQIDIENDESIIAAVKYIAEKYGKLDGQSPPVRTNWLKADDLRSSHKQRCRRQLSKVSGPPRRSVQP
jgi:nucleoside-diphosphate-sugar epimerase